MRIINKEIGCCKECLYHYSFYDHYCKHPKNKTGILLSLKEMQDHHDLVEEYKESLKTFFPMEKPILFRPGHEIHKSCPLEHKQ